MYISFSKDGRILVWDMASMRALRTAPTRSTNEISLVKFSPKCVGTDRWLVSVCGAKRLEFWHWNGATRVFAAHASERFKETSNIRARIVDCEFTRDGGILAASVHDGTTCVCVYTLHDEGVERIAELELDKHRRLHFDELFDGVRFVTAANGARSPFAVNYKANEWLRCDFVDRHEEMALVRPTSNSTPTHDSDLLFVEMTSDCTLLVTGHQRHSIKYVHCVAHLTVVPWSYKQISL